MLAKETTNKSEISKRRTASDQREERAGGDIADQPAKPPSTSHPEIIQSHTLPPVTPPFPSPPPASIPPPPVNIPPPVNTSSPPPPASIPPPPASISPPPASIPPPPVSIPPPADIATPGPRHISQLPPAQYQCEICWRKVRTKEQVCSGIANPTIIVCPISGESSFVGEAQWGASRAWRRTGHAVLHPW